MENAKNHRKTQQQTLKTSQLLSQPGKSCYVSRAKAVK
jgi:hypothetical protein